MNKHTHNAINNGKGVLTCSICGLHIGRIITGFLYPYSGYYWYVREELPLKEGAPINHDRMSPGGIIHEK